MRSNSGVGFKITFRMAQWVGQEEYLATGRHFELR